MENVTEYKVYIFKEVDMYLQYKLILGRFIFMHYGWLFHIKYGTGNKIMQIADDISFCDKCFIKIRIEMSEDEYCFQSIKITSKLKQFLGYLNLN